VGRRGSELSSGGEALFSRARGVLARLLRTIRRRRHPVAALTFGIPVEWRDFERRHAALLQSVLPPLMEASTRVLARKVESEHPHDRLVFMLGRHIPEDFNEIFVLAANGYGVGGLKLLRPMYERLVTMMYLIRNPERAEDFVDWHLIEKQRTLNLLKDEGDEPTNYLTAEEVAQVKADYERVKGRFPKKQRSWTKLDLKSMARKVGVEKMYLSLCHWPTLQIHTTAIGMTTRIEETDEGVVFKTGPQREEADRALLGAHTCLLLALDTHIRHFGLAVDLAPRIDEYKKYWGAALQLEAVGRASPTPPLPAPESAAPSHQYQAPE
jgi:hypothetical protein